MPNLTGAMFPFADSSPDVEVDIEDVEEIQAEVYDSVGSDLALARAHAAPIVEFLTIPFTLPGGSTQQSLKVLNYDASRKRVFLSAVNGYLLLSRMRISGQFQATNSILTALTGTLPAIQIATTPYVTEVATQEELWVTPWSSTATNELLFLTIEKYAQ